MVSKFVDALLRPKDSNLAFRKKLLEYLDDGVSLRHLRTVSRALHDLVDHHPGRLFRGLYVKAPLTEQQDVSTLEILMPFCHSLTITIEAEKKRNSVSGMSSASKGPSGELAAAKSKNSLASASWHKRRQSVNSTSTTRLTARASMHPSRLQPDQRSAQHTAKRRWLNVFSRCLQLQILTLRVHGDPAWPGRTDVEDAVIHIRTALEQSDVPNLREVRLTPVHAMGIIHLRWTALSAFGTLPSPESSPLIWERLEVLHLQLRNPLGTGKLSAAQELMFRKTLYEYLRSFTPTLRCLRFIWLDSEGPSPLTLHLEPGVEERQPLAWHTLEELWVGNVTYPNRAIRLASELAQKLGRLWTLRSTHRDSRVDVADPNAWVDILLGKDRSDPGTWADSASSIYSHSAHSSVYDPGRVSDTSRIVPFMLDLTDWRR